MASPQQPQAQPPAATISTRSQQKADASKSFLEQHYMGMLRSMSVGQEARPVNQPREKEVGPTDFSILKLIGRGAFGEVFIVRMKDDPDPEKLYAMKRMLKSEMLKKRKVTHVRSENNIMAHAGRESPWIVTLHYSFQDDKYLYMIMDYMPGGDMMTWLCNEGTFTVEATRFYIAELSTAVHSVHECEYVHRDIKPDNILMDAVGHTKLSDFGLCKAFPKSGDYIVDLYSALEQERGTQPQPRGMLAASAPAPAPFSESEPFETRDISAPTITPASPSGSPTGPIGESPGPGASRAQRRVQFNSIVGSPGYIAPEILNRQPYTTACDWWSVGVIMYEMLYGRTPFYNPDPQKTGHMIVHWQEYLRFPQGRGVPETAIDLMKKLLCAQDERISMAAIREHPFFAGVDWEHLQETTPAFCPVLSDPLDTRYFPPNEELVRPPQAESSAQDPLLQEDPRGVLFADFRFDKRKASSRRSTST